MRPWFAPALAILAALALAASGVAPTRAGAPPPSRAPGTVDLAAAPPLSLSAAELRALVDSVPAPADEDVECVFESIRDTFGADGTRTWSHHSVCRALTTRGVEIIRTLRQSWKPGYDDRPDLRGRVIAADGQVYELDPRTLSEQPVAASQDVYTDLRSLAAPLPGVAPGAIVEQVATVTELAPAFRSGHLMLRTLDTSYPTRRFVVTIDGPDSLPLTWRVIPAPDARPPTPHHTRADGRATLRFDFAPTQRPVPLGDPPSISSWTMLAATTAPSWASVADEYAQLVATTLAAPPEPGATDLALLAREIAAGATDRDEILARIHAWIADKLRYTSISLGDAAWAPRTPGQVLSRAYGDCKDLSTLFVALARALDIDADVALVRSGRFADPLPDIPGLGWFDHAIVFVPGAIPRWLDPTQSRVAAGAIASSLVGRPALIARPGQTSLAPIGGAVSGEGWTDERELRLRVDGPADVTETTTAHGTAGGRIRAWVAGLGGGERADADAWRGYVREEYGEFSAVRSVVSGITPLVDPVVVRLEIDGVTGPTLERGAGLVSLGFGGVLSALPTALDEELPATSVDERRWRARWLERTTPLDLARPERAELLYRVVLPPGVEPAGDVKLPDGFEVGPVRFAASSAREGQTLVVRFALETGATPLAPAEVAALNAALIELGAHRVVQIPLRSTVDTHIADGEPVEALRAAHALHRAHPDEPATWPWLVEALGEVGLGEAARDVAREMVARWPGRADAHITLGQTLLHDPLWRFLEPGSLPDEAVAALRAGLALDPAHVNGRRWLAIGLALGDMESDGVVADPARADAAIEALALLLDDGDTRFVTNHAWLLTQRGRLDEAIAAVEAQPTELTRGRYLLVAVALRDGVAATHERRARLAGDAKDARGLLFGAAISLAEMGRYGVAADLLDAATETPNNDATARRLRDLYRRAHDGAASLDDGPCGAARRWYGAHVLADGGSLRAGLPERYRSPDGWIPASDLNVGLGLAELRTFTGHTGAVAARLAAHVMRCEAGERVGRATPVALTLDAGAGVRTMHAFVVALPKPRRAPRGGVAPAAHEVFPALPSFLGAEALAALAGRRVDEARALLALAFATSDAMRVEIALTAWGRPAEVAGLAELSPGRLGVLAALLAPTGPQAAEALRRLQADDAKAASAALGELVSRSTARARLATGAFEAALDELVARAKRGEANEELALEALGGAFRGPRAYAEALTSRLDALKVSAYVAIAAQEIVLLRRGDFGAARALLEATVAEHEADTRTGRLSRNQLGWLTLFDGGDLEAALTAVDAITRRTTADEHTRATLLAALDRPTEAMAALIRAVALRGHLTRYDDVVLGRVAESHGLHDAARRYYERAAKDESESPLNARDLATRWLDTLGRAPATR